MPSARASSTSLAASGLARCFLISFRANRIRQIESTGLASQYPDSAGQLTGGSRLCHWILSVKGGGSTMREREEGEREGRYAGQGVPEGKRGSGERREAGGRRQRRGRREVRGRGTREGWMREEG